MKRAAEGEEYRDVVMLMHARDGLNCRAANLVTDVRCGGPLDPHHVAGRNSRHDRLNLATLIQVCRNHHNWIDNHPDKAKELGLKL